MSYSILYDRQVVKIDDNLYCPFILAGDSNLWETQPSRRVRNWQFFTFLSKGKMCLSREELQANYEQELIERKQRYKGDKDVEDHYGRYAALAINGKKQVSFGSYRNFIMNELTTAMTIEELATHDIRLTLAVSYYDEKDLIKAGKIIRDPMLIISSSHFHRQTALWKEYYGQLFQPSWLSIGSDSRLEELRSSKKDFRQRKPRKLKEVNHYYVLARKDGPGYFFKATIRRYFYYQQPSQARKFKSEKSAQDYLDKSRFKDLFAVKPINEKVILPA